MSSWFSKKKQRARTGRVGLSFTHDGFSLCHVERGESSKPRLTLARSVEGLSTGERGAALAELVAEAGLAGTNCVVVLPTDEYALRTLDRPQVEDDEIASSLPWLIRDVIEFDVAEAAVACCDFPADAIRGRDPRLFVAAARAGVVEEATRLVTDAGLVCEAIDVAELALRNIGEELPRQVAGTVFLDLGPKSGLLTIYHESNLYFTRSISTGTRQIEDALGNEISLDPTDDSLGHHMRSLLDELLLEIQRSLDYYESELGKAPASRLIIAPSLAEISVYVPYLTEQLRPVSVESLDLAALVETDEALGNELQTRILLPLGGALRADLDQQIDFARPNRARPALSTLPLPWVAALSAAAATGLLLIWAIGLHRNHELASRVVLAAQRQDAVNAQLAELESRLSQRTDSMASEDPLADVRAERDRSAARLRALDALGADRRTGFSRYFAGFARQRVDQLWLDRIEVSDGGATLSIRGRTHSARRVPQLLRRLRDEPAFAGKTFSLFRLDSDEAAGVLDFALEGQPAGEGAP